MHSKKLYSIYIDDHEFKFNLEQLCLIAPAVFHFYQRNCTNFVLNSKTPKENEGIIKAMECLQSLFTTEIAIELNKENEQYFSILADIFGNIALKNALNSVSQINKCSFSLSFENLSLISIQALNNITLIINNHSFQSNLFFLCTISNAIFSSFHQNPKLLSLQIEILNKNKDEVIHCFSRIIDFLSGQPFSFEGFSAPTFFEVVDKLEIVGFDDILLQLYPIPNKFKEAIKFLQFKFAFSLTTYFNKSIQIVSSKFYKFNPSDVPPFSFNVFQSLLSCSDLVLENETMLLKIILEKVKIDSSFSSLLKFVHFPFVDCEVLVDLFSQINLFSVDLLLFENIKKRMIEAKLPIEQEFALRWKNPPLHLSENETKEVIEMIEDICSSKENILKELKGFIGQHQFYEELILAQNQEIQLLKHKIHKQSLKLTNRFNNIDSKLDFIFHTLTENQAFNQETHQKIQTEINSGNVDIKQEIKNKKQELIDEIKFLLHGKSVPFQKKSQGIIQDLKNSDSNSISLSCSSFLSSDVPENILIYDNKTAWHSEDKSNSWISMKFNTRKIKLSGYFFRSFHGAGGSNPKTWKVEASNDGNKWILIDEQKNLNWITHDFSEVYFPTETKDAFSYFKFTQTGGNYINYNYFALNFLELFGMIYAT
jgi:hypothetical protein